MLEQRTGVYNNPYKFNAKELDKETGLYYYGARYYNPRASIWYGVDPLAVYNPAMETQFYGDGQHNGGVYFWGNLNPYIYTYQNPINLIDPNGKQTTGQQIGIAARNPLKIGLMNRAGNALADRAGEFSRRGATASSPNAILERNGPVASDPDRGRERGAFRHATWMALIASEYGSKDAKWVGDLHEGKPTETNKTSNILGIMGADTIADELNNQIGRRFGEKHKDAESRDIALGMLEIYHTEMDHIK